MVLRIFDPDFLSKHQEAMNNIIVSVCMGIYPTASLHAIFII